MIIALEKTNFTKYYLHIQKKTILGAFFNFN